MTTRGWIVICVAVVVGMPARPVQARPGGGRVGGHPAGGMARPAMPMARPQMPAARPQVPMARPQMPMARPQMPAARPQMPMARPTMPSVSRPQSLPRPSLGAGQPSASARPSPPRPGIGAIRPTPATRPAPGPSRPGGGFGRPVTTLPGQVGGRPGIVGPATKPAFPQPTPGTRPGVPTTKPAPPPGLGGGRPGGNRPGLGSVQRPTTLPGSRPDWTRPGGGPRPGFGGNRPGIGSGNNLWNSGNWNTGNIGSGNWNNFNNVTVNRPWGGGGWAGGGWNSGGWGYPGVGGWGNAWCGGCVNPHYGWYNGCWGGGWWAPFAAGAATWGLASTVANWGLGANAWGYTTAYANPYYAAVPAAVVAASPYDYAQPVAVTTYADAAPAPAAPPVDTVTEAERAFDEALARFKAGDYPAALAGCDRAVRLSPKDPIVHEFRALALFALARYPEAAATLNAVLAAAPGMDWTTMSGLYPSVDAYTTQLRALETFCRRHSDDAAAHFVLAYHYLVGGHNALAADALRVVVARQPGDAVATQLLAALGHPAQPADAAGDAATAGSAVDLVGTWRATAGGDAVELMVKEDATFVWRANPRGGSAVEISGTVETSGDALAMVSEQAGTMGGTVAAKGPDGFEFVLAGGPPGAKPLLFERLK